MSRWKEDRILRETFRVKQRDTLPFTGWSAYTRKDLAKLYNTLGYKVGAEIGVQGGRHARLMFQTIPDLKLYCVDPWESYNRMKEHKIKALYERCLKRLEGYNAEIMKMTSMEAVGKIPDGSLDFVYIDALHEFDSVMMDIICWSPKVRIGGIIAGHDYFKAYQVGVMPAVNAYTRAHNINDWYITTAYTPSRSRKEIELDESPSFFWVQKKEYISGYG